MLIKKDYFIFLKTAIVKSKDFTKLVFFAGILTGIILTRTFGYFYYLQIAESEKNIRYFLAEKNYLGKINYDYVSKNLFSDVYTIKNAKLSILDNWQFAHKIKEITLHGINNKKANAPFKIVANGVFLDVLNSSKTTANVEKIFADLKSFNPQIDFLKKPLTAFLLAGYPHLSGKITMAFLPIANEAKLQVKLTASFDNFAKLDADIELSNISEENARKLANYLAIAQIDKKYLATILDKAVLSNVSINYIDSGFINNYFDLIDNLKLRRINEKSHIRLDSGDILKLGDYFIKNNLSPDISKNLATNLGVFTNSPYQISFIGNSKDFLAKNIMAYDLHNFIELVAKLKVQIQVKTNPKYEIKTNLY